MKVIMKPILNESKLNNGRIAQKNDENQSIIG